jgi:NAD(P)-dependent dehydrogenase (short-subunit alcohol dehydrogenase family)
MQNVDGRVAFITGGASGIGLGIARAFAAAGVRLMLADMRDDRLAEAAASLTSAGTEVATIKVDVADRVAMAAAAARTVERFGKVHIVVANAGVGVIGRVRDASYDDWDWSNAVNLGGVINTVQEFLPLLRRQGEGGHLVATASMGGLTPVPHGGVYSVQKAAVVAIMEALYTELAAEGIHASVICPGMTRTNIAETLALRPTHFSDHGIRLAPPPQAVAASGPGPMALAMDPTELGERVLKGILANDLYILTHNEFAEQIREQFEPILAAMPKEEPAMGPAAAGGVKFSAYERVLKARGTSVQ